MERRLCSRPRQGASCTLYPSPGPLALDPECANLSYSSFVFPYVSEGYKKKQHHGHNENDQNSGWENRLSHRLFFRFPRMLCIRLAAFCRRARGCRWHLQFTMLQSSFAKGLLCAFHRVGNKSSVSPSGCHLPLQ